jgi:hypothetical protein
MPEVITPPSEAVPSAPPTAAKDGRKSSEERKEALARIITAQVVDGARVESQSEYQVVLARGHRLNNFMHLILTIVTFGLWGIVWLLLGLFGGEKRRVAFIDEWGNSSIQSEAARPVRALHDLERVRKALAAARDAARGELANVDAREQRSYRRRRLT